MLYNFFDYLFPYIMCMHQEPVNSGDFLDYFYFNIEFLLPMRAADKQKFNSYSETGAWVACNPTATEKKGRGIESGT